MNSTFTSLKPTAFQTQTKPLQDDWAGWIDFTGSVKDKVQTVGDDLTVTNIKRIKRAADEGACNALLLKVHAAGLCFPWFILSSFGV